MLVYSISEIEFNWKKYLENFVYQRASEIFAYRRHPEKLTTTFVKNAYKISTLVYNLSDFFEKNSNF